MTENLLARPLRLPCGAILPNRIAKAAMTEGLADSQLRPTDRHAQLYRTWAEGGAGMLLTGNVMIDRRVLERPGNVAIDSAHPEPDTMTRLKVWAKAGTSNGNHLWMQISPAGRQSPRYVVSEPLAPSAVQLNLAGNYRMPRALLENEILDLIERFGHVARTAREAGFTGVQIHGAHGYLISSFLSPITNIRTDAWGGSLANRARFLLAVVASVRAAVGPDFPVGLKLNSSDFQKGGFSNKECLQVVEWLNGAGVDLLEVSGGSYEQPRLVGHVGEAATAIEMPRRDSTRRREAYFLDYAAGIRKVATMPLMVTGGFRSRSGMEQAMREDGIDVIGIGRPLVTDPDVPNRLLAGEDFALPAYEHTLHWGSGMFGPTSKVTALRMVNIIGQQGWYCREIERRSRGLASLSRQSVLGAFVDYMMDENIKARRLLKARRQAI